LIKKLCLAVLFLVGLSVYGWSQEASLRYHTIKSPAIAGARLPRLTAMPDRQGVLMSWVEPYAEGHALKFAVLRDGNWIRQGEVAYGDNWFVNWADYPSVVAIDEQFWVAHWLTKQKGGKTFDYDIALAISNDAGATWREIGHPHRDGTASEHGFVTVFKNANAAGVIWLDGREYAKKTERAQHPEKSGNFNLRYTRIYRDGSMDAEQIIDANTCTCCWTSVAVTNKGPIAVWRGRTDDEIRDNRFSLLRGSQWTAPDALGGEGWKIEGCPVNGPSVAAHGKNVAAAWFTSQGDRPRVRAAFSQNSGEIFSNPVEIDDVAPLGRIGLGWKDEQTAIVSWMTAANPETKKSSLAFRTVSKDGSMGSVKRILELSSGRDTGVPQMIVDAQGILLAWTDAGPNHGVKMARVGWKDFQSLSSTQKVSVSQNTAPFSAYICRQPH